MSLVLQNVQFQCKRTQEGVYKKRHKSVGVGGPVAARIALRRQREINEVGGTG